MSATATQPQPQCSKCEGPLDTEGYPLWCRKCRAKYRREYNEVRDKLEGTQNFTAGAEAMREFLAEKFSVYSIQRFSGPEISSIIKAAKAPAASGN